MQNTRRVLYFLLLLCLIVSITACAKQNDEPQVIKVAVLPVLDTLPLYIAESQGYFEDLGITVELVPVSSAPERDQLMQAGQIDGMLTELTSSIIYNKDEIKVQVVRFARTASSDYPVFRILSAPDSGLLTVNDLKNIEIGISNGTVIEYTTDRLLENSGFTEDEIKSISIPKIADRMALLMSGEVKAANLPDPAASLAIKHGANLIIDDTTLPEVSYSVYTFSIDALKKKPEAVKAFLAAVEKAVNDINTDKTRWRDVLLEKQLISEEIIDSYALPDYPNAGVPDESQYEDVMDWLFDKEMITQASKYEDNITDQYLP